MSHVLTIFLHVHAGINSLLVGFGRTNIPTSFQHIQIKRIFFFRVVILFTVYDNSKGKKINR